MNATKDKNFSVLPVKRNMMLSAYEHIKSGILEGVLYPGALLDENAIASELEMSRTPVREAIRLLASEDLIEIKNGIGAYVKRMSLKDMRDICVVRKTLEVLAMQSSIDEITTREIDGMEEKFVELLRKHRSGQQLSIKEYVEIDFNLHEMFVEKCTNRYVRQMMHGIFDQIKRYQCLSYEPFAGIEESTAQHLEILTLLRARDAKALEQAILSHIEWSYEFFQRNHRV